VLTHRLRMAMADPSSISAPVIMHTCDNPHCCNPRHLRAGSYADNIQDMYAKGRNSLTSADHLRDRVKHPRSKPVSTPSGDFPSATRAAEALGLHVRMVSRYCQQQRNGWSFVCPPPHPLCQRPPTVYKNF
jgi:hypothetical protein